MRGTPLPLVRTMLKAELGENLAPNDDRDMDFNQLISNMQRRLVTEHALPLLERRWDVGIAAGGQYATLPTQTAGDPETEMSAIDIDGMRPKVEVFYNQVYQDVDYGIGEDEYNTLNFALGQQSDPIQRWRIATNPNEASNPNSFEVWPVPVTPQVLRFTGQRSLLPALGDNDTLDLDDMLVVLFLASELLARAKQADSTMKFTAAQRRLQWLKQNYPTRDSRRTLDGMGDSAFKRDRKLVGMTIVVR